MSCNIASICVVRDKGKHWPFVYHSELTEVDGLKQVKGSRLRCVVFALAAITGAVEHEIQVKGGDCLKSMLETISMQGYLATITSLEEFSFDKVNGP